MGRKAGWQGVCAIALMCLSSPALADWLTLHFGQDGPEALQKLPSLSQIAPDQAKLAGRGLYGSLDPATASVLQARYEARNFTAKANFVFSAGKLYAIEIAPRNISPSDIVALLTYDYGAPLSVTSISPQAIDYAWRDDKAGNFVLFRIGSSEEPRVVYRPLTQTHSTGF